MKRQAFTFLTLGALIFSGCATTALRHNTSNESKTVSDIYEDEVLYNLALSHDFYSNTRVNGLPSFVTLSSGMATITESLSGTLTVKVTTGPSEEDPGATGTHMTADNWAFTPVNDPNQLKRLLLLYKAEFKKISQGEVDQLFQPGPPATDSQGRPILDYFPDTNTDGYVKLDKNNNPIFKAKPKPTTPHHTRKDIPGAVIGRNEDGTKKRSKAWFSFEQPAGLSLKEASACRMGPYLNHYIWITNRTNYLNFTLLVLGGTSTNASSGSFQSNPNLLSSPVLFLNQNGLIRPYQ
jgi:hypothetical protein